jgi:hypothetical protein
MGDCAADDWTCSDEEMRNRIATAGCCLSM